MRKRMKNQTKRPKKRPTRKKRSRKIKGGFLSDLSYLMSRGASLFQVGAPVAAGNPSLPVKPFSYVQ